MRRCKISTAELKLNGTTIISESGGTATFQNAALSNNMTFPAGHVIQTKFFADNGGEKLVSSTTFEATTLTLDITPQITGSSILIIISAHLRADGGAEKSVGGKIYKSVNQGTFSEVTSDYQAYVSENANETYNSIMWMDSDSISSGVRYDYKLYINSPNATDGRYNSNIGITNSVSTILLQEIAQ